MAYSFQTPTLVMMITVAVTGLSSGMISLKKMVARLAPSIIPASSMDSGMALIKDVYRKMARGRLPAVDSRMMPQ